MRLLPLCGSCNWRGLKAAGCDSQRFNAAYPSGGSPSTSLSAWCRTNYIHSDNFCESSYPPLKKPPKGGCFNGGGDEIRTHGTVSRTHTFQACALDHSATPPHILLSALALRKIAPAEAQRAKVGLLQIAGFPLSRE